MKISARHNARELAVQAIYSWQLSNNNIGEIEDHFLSENNTSDIDINYFKELLVGVISNRNDLDNLMKPYLSRQLKHVGQIEKAILRLSLFELNSRRDIPYRVVINEGIELAKTFAAKDSYKFVNSILDKVAFFLRYKKY
ncbi:transcription antitermination factor NusB [Candidatus Ishikawella capsulata]|uniref:Transcription antitermination protein NusB n=1 Tax=Candidatus Ishikawaella capsulata Mpkobe TaxID=476281 RepID=C5WCP3_9ENTR|nr:transcription antitermination factor NusB [Candidatus Ishikawaella capsulata]BAH83099.1 transcription antitermination protein NusB [Candidatus Ishikawaella capsulata Mpkobe]